MDIVDSGIVRFKDGREVCMEVRGIVRKKGKKEGWINLNGKVKMLEMIFEKRLGEKWIEI